MKFKQMFQDDKTKELSLSRVTISVLVTHYLIMASIVTIHSSFGAGHTIVFPDFPAITAGLVSLLYGVNKTVSNTTGVKGN